MQLSERLLHLRMENKLSQLDVAAALNTSRQTVSKWETGATIPTSEKLIGLAKLYDVSIDILVGHTVKSEKDTESPEEHERHIESPAELTEPASLVENSEPFVATQSGKSGAGPEPKRDYCGACAPCCW